MENSQNIPYKAIARRYRPQKFSDVIGQDPVVATLKNALRMDKVAHAYIFCGLRGTGKTTLARLFAKALNCEHPSEEAEPCNTCPSCVDITSGKSLDVIEIDGASNRGIDDIREITENIGYASAQGRYKIVIIDEVHMLTKEAFNALLKTLEEPPENVKFFLATTEPHKVLPTIMSRCQRFDLSRISSEIIKQKLKAIALDLALTYDEASLDLIVQRSEGSMRDAESLFEQLTCCLSGALEISQVTSALGRVPETLIHHLDSAFHERNLSAAFTIAEEIFSKGKDPLVFMEQLAEHFREILALKLGQSEALLGRKPSLSALQAEKLYTEEECLFLIDFLAKSLPQAFKISFKRLHLESTLLHILRSKNRLSLSSILKRLVDLEHKLGRAPAEEIAAPEKKFQPEEPPKVVEKPVNLENKKPTHHYDTLMRFAAVELEGTLKK